MATKCLLKLQQIASNDADVQYFSYQLKEALQGEKDSVDEKTIQLINKMAKDALRTDQSLDTWRSTQEKKLTETATKDDLSGLIRGLDSLSLWGSNADVISKYKSEAGKSWPEAKAFH